MKPVATYAAIPLNRERIPKFKVRAPKGWRAVVFFSAPMPEGVRALGAGILNIAVLKITWWAIEPPHISPGDPEFEKPTMHRGAVLPMFGKTGIFPSDDVRFFTFAGPDDDCTDEELAMACSDWHDANVAAGKKLRKGWRKT
jgi:hypothetical protein